jgi:hypothetical protein
MDELVERKLGLDELVEAEMRAEKPKRVSHAKRLQRVRDFQAKDIAALENLVETLLGHLERAIQPDVTDNDRDRYRRMANDIRGHLNNE